MRILIVDTCYPAFLSAHYRDRPLLAEEPYEIQWRALMDRFFGTCDSYSHFLGLLGHEAHEVVVNCQPLQRAWEREHDLGPRKRLRALLDRSVIVAQAQHLNPDVVYVQDLNVLSTRVLKALRSSTQLLVGQIASEAPSHDRLALYDLLVTSFPHYVRRFRASGLNSEYLRIGFDPRVLEHVEKVAPAEDVVFIGALSRTQHSRGNEVLERAARKTGIAFWGYNADGWPSGSAIRRGFRGEAWGLDMYRLLASSKIALNRHIDVAEDYANNMRLFEATGVGTLLLTDAKRNLDDLFRPGDEIVTYDDEHDLVRKVESYLADDRERTRVAQAGQARTLREHTYEHRMRDLVTILGAYLK